MVGSSERPRPIRQSVDSSPRAATIEPSEAGDSRSATVFRAGHHPAHLDNRIRVPAPTGGRQAKQSQPQYGPDARGTDGVCHCQGETSSVAET